jgi:uncharacterized protein with PIN domain
VKRVQPMRIPQTDLGNSISNCTQCECYFWQAHWRQLDLCETSFLLLNGSHWNLKFSPT